MRRSALLLACLGLLAFATLGDTQSGGHLLPLCTVAAGPNQCLNPVPPSGSNPGSQGREAWDTSQQKVVVDNGSAWVTLGPGGGLPDPVTVAHGGTGATTAPTALTNLGAQAAITVTAKTGSGGGNYTTTSATYVDVDGTNLTYTVTVASGRTLLVLVTGTCWGLAAPPVVGLDKDGTITVEVETGGTAPLALSYSFSSDGAAHTWKLRFHGDGVKDATILNTSAVNAPRMTFLVI